MLPKNGSGIFTRDFVLGCLAQFAFCCVNYILIPTLPIYLSRLGSTESEIGVLIGTFGVASLVLRPLVGMALLKHAEKRFMMLGSLFFAVASFSYLWVRPFWPFLIVRILQGIGLAFFNTSVFTLIASVAPDLRRGQALSYFWLAPNLALVLAPALGMVLINQFSFFLLFIVCFGVSVCSLTISSRLENRQSVHVDGSLQSAFFLDRQALPPSVVIFFFYFIWGALTTFFPLYAVQNGVRNPGLFFTAMAVVLILGRALGAKILDVYPREKVIVYFLGVCILSLVILAFSKSLPMFILVGIIYGVGAAFLNPAVMAYTLDRAGPSRGPAMGTYTGFTDLGVSIGPVIMGLLIPWIGYSVMFLCLGFVGVIDIVYFQLFLKRSTLQ